MAAPHPGRWTLGDWLGDEVPVTVAGLALDDVTLDSRRAGPGSAFLALAGSRRHGMAHGADAVARGVAAVVFDPAGPLPDAPLEAEARRRGVVLLPLGELEARAGELVSRFFGDPSQALAVVGVTGTDGKTSVTQFIAQCLGDDAKPGGIVGTLGWGFPGRLEDTGLTTPDLVSVHRLLALLRERGAGSVAMEVSSHALHQGRVRGLRFRSAVLTNLTRDHLDYHGTPEAYAEAKARLFASPGLGAAVLNLDDAFGRRLAAELPAAIERYGYSVSGAAADARLRCVHLRARPGGLDLRLSGPDGEVDLTVPLLGRFNAANVLACLGALLSLGVPWPDAVRRAGAIRPVPGRMEPFGGAGAPTVVVDYAHTPAALAAAIAGLRDHFSGRLWCVFGCGGDRDRGKRPEMGAVASAADRVVITSDNPRGEPPADIIREIAAGLPAGHAAERQPDRAAAIRRAVAEAQPGDVVLVAGKGHEDYQQVGERRLPFRDRDIVRRALEARG